MVNPGKKKRVIGPPPDHIKRFLDGLIDRIMARKEASQIRPIVGLSEIKELCHRSKELLLIENVLVELDPNIFVLGDIHGQLPDLKNMLRLIGMPPKSRLLFLGDYVDRGGYSVETISLLLAMKLRYPDHIFLLRGNHETRLVNRSYGFFQECMNKYGKDPGLELWTLFQHVFNSLPMAALVGRLIFCVHGGISDSLCTFEQFNRMRRPMDVTDVGVVTDLIWSDPSQNVEYFGPSPRGVSNIFGKKAVDDFCHKLKIRLIVRAHQCVPEGYEHFADGRLVTIFSAPAYNTDPDNAAGILHIKTDMSCQIYTYRRPKMLPHKSPNRSAEIGVTQQSAQSSLQKTKSGS